MSAKTLFTSVDSLISSKDIKSGVNVSSSVDLKEADSVEHSRGKYTYKSPSNRNTLNQMYHVKGLARMCQKMVSEVVHTYV